MKKTFLAIIAASIIGGLVGSGYTLNRINKCKKPIAIDPLTGYDPSTSLRIEGKSLKESLRLAGPSKRQLRIEYLQQKQLCGGLRHWLNL